MNFLESIFNTSTLEAFGLTLMHSLWQGALVALVLAFLLFVLRRSSSKSRYYVSLSSLVVLFVSTVITFFIILDVRQTLDVVQLDSTFSYAIIVLGNPEALANVEQVNALWLFIGEMTYYFQSHAPLLVAAWLMGVLVLTLRLAGGYTLAQRMKTYKTRAVESYWEDKLTTLMDKVGISKAVKLLESGIAKVPMVIGHLKPVILVPTGMLSGLTPQQVEAVLAHELAHIKRHDYLVNLAQSVLEIILFYHPATWWIASCIREERENACDDVAIQVSGDSLSFARALTSLEQRSLGAPQLAMAFYGNKGSLINRIRRLIGKPNHRGSLPEGIVLLSLVCLGFFSFAFQVDDRKEKATKETVKEAKTVESALEYEFTKYYQAVEDSSKKSKRKDKREKDKNKKKDKSKIKEKEKDEKIKVKKGSKVVIAGDERQFPLLLDMDELGIAPTMPLIISIDDSNKNFQFPNIKIDSSYGFNFAPIEPMLWTPSVNDNIFLIPEINMISPKLSQLAVPLELENLGEKIIINLSDRLDGVNHVYDYSLFDDSNYTSGDSTKNKEYRKAREMYRKALKEYRQQQDSQRVELQKHRQEYVEKYQAELKKYREELQKQQEEMLEARKKELAKLREVYQVQAEEWRKRGEEFRVKAEEQAKAQQAFWDEMRKQLVKDGLLNDEDDQLKLYLDEDMMKVNGTKVTDDLHKKYKKLFSKQYGGADFQWRNNGNRIILDID